MRRTSWALLAGLLLLLAGVGRAADTAPVGNWKMSLYLDGKARFLWLIQIESAKDKVTAKVLDQAERAPDVTVSDAKVADGKLRLTLTVGKEALQFEGQLPKGESKVIAGNVSPPRGEVIPAELERTKAVDVFDIDKEGFATATGYEITDAALRLIKQAAKHKVKPDEVSSWAEKAYKAAGPYRARIQNGVTQQLAQLLIDQDGYAEAAVVYARRAEQALGAKAKPEEVAEALEVLASALRIAGKIDEAKEVQARLAKLTEVTAKPFLGRKAKSDRVVLVELFTGAQCPPCYAADKAFDVLDKTYKPSEVVLLEYHAHIPGPDPLTIAAGEARFEYYFGEGGGTPSCLFNGKQEAKGGGGRSLEAGTKKYEEFVAAINPLLETPAKAELKLTATRSGTKIEIRAEAGDIAKPGDNVRLRLALIEDVVEYKGTNGIPSYRHVVRAMPKGAEGVAIKERAVKESATVDLDEVKKDIKKYLDEQAKQGMTFPGKVPAVELKNLRVIAFVQDDKTKEVLQAVQAHVKNEK